MNAVRKLYYNLVINLYRPYLKKLPLFETLAFLLKYRLVPHLTRRGDQRYKDPLWNHDGSCKVRKIAVICDEMTWQNFLGELEMVYLTPQNWYSELERTKPDLLFCESTWHGNDDHNGCWDYRIIHNRRLLTDNRIALLRILKYCKKAGIKTVFWNKEDPVFFNDVINNFVDTALLFDYIFTTAAECVPLYQEKGHESVGVMMFGFSPRIFSPVKCIKPRNAAVFFGSWYSDQPQRCIDMTDTFDMVLNNGLELVIYDRYWNSTDENNRFPKKYRPYIRQGIRYSEIRNVLQDISYVININTVKDSETMFARRVFELMACGKIIISNYSRGMDRLFGDHVWFTDRPFDLGRAGQIIDENIKLVYTYHTWSSRLDEMLHVMGFERQ